MLTGTIKRTNTEAGYGFVADEKGVDYFFHRTGAENFESLRVGDTVTFEPEQGPKGPRANQVRLAEAPATA